MHRDTVFMDSWKFSDVSCQRVIVEPIADIVDEQDLADAIEKTFSTNTNGHFVICPGARNEDTENDAFASAAKRLLKEIFEEEQREAERYENETSPECSFNVFPANYDIIGQVASGSKKRSSRDDAGNVRKLQSLGKKKAYVSSKQPDGRLVLKRKEAAPKRKRESNGSIHTNKVKRKERDDLVPSTPGARKKTEAAVGGHEPARPSVQKLIINLKNGKVIKDSPSSSSVRHPDRTDDHPRQENWNETFAINDDLEAGQKNSTAALTSNGDLKASASTHGNELEEMAQEMEYPCTVCRKCSHADELTRCQNCPRYFHRQCFNGTNNNDCLCPKCSRASVYIGSSSGQIGDKKKRPQKVTRGTPDDNVKRPKNSTDNSDTKSGPNGLLRMEEWNERPCPGCRKIFKCKEQESIYCSENCVEMVIERVKRTVNEPHERILVADGSTGVMLGKSHSPTLANFPVWIRRHRQHYPILNAVSTKEQSKAAPDVAVEAKIQVKERSTISKEDVHHQQPSSSKGITSTTSTSGSVIDRVRLTVRKAFLDVLIMRAKEADDILLSNGEIKLVALDLEQNVYKIHQGTSSAYQDQCRNLITNLRSPSNQGFFRLLLNGELSCKRAASLTAQQMASKECSWPAKVKERRLSNGQIPASSPKPQAQTSLFNLLHKDTTVEHKSHLYDSNCRICTGKGEDPSSSILVKRKVRGTFVPKPSMKPKVENGSKGIRIENDPSSWQRSISMPYQKSDHSYTYGRDQMSPQGSISEMSPLSTDSLPQYPDPWSTRE